MDKCRVEENADEKRRMGRRLPVLFLGCACTGKRSEQHPLDMRQPDSVPMYIGICPCHPHAETTRASPDPDGHRDRDLPMPPDNALSRRNSIQSSMMIVDIQQLPIPEWHLRCPNCSYLLNGLPGHRCAECGDSLDMATIIPTWARLREPRFTGEELPLPDFGLYCNNCDTPLAGVKQHECPSCHELFEPMKSRPAKAWFVANTIIEERIAPQLLAMMLEREFVPYTLEETQNPVTGSLSWSLHVMSDFYFEFLWLLRCRLCEAENVSTQIDWQCQTCDNENPANFETCWHCGESQR